MAVFEGREQSQYCGMIDGVKGEGQMQNFSFPLVLLLRTRASKLGGGGGIILIMVGGSGIGAFI